MFSPSAALSMAAGVAHVAAVHAQAQQAVSSDAKRRLLQDQRKKPVLLVDSTAAEKQEPESSPKNLVNVQDDHLLSCQPPSTDSTTTHAASFGRLSATTWSGSGNGLYKRTAWAACGPGQVCAAYYAVDQEQEQQESTKYHCVPHHQAEEETPQQDQADSHHHRRSLNANPTMPATLCPAQGGMLPSGCAVCSCNDYDGTTMTGTAVCQCDMCMQKTYTAGMGLTDTRMCVSTTGGLLCEDTANNCYTLNGQACTCTGSETCEDGSMQTSFDCGSGVTQEACVRGVSYVCVASTSNDCTAGNCTNCNFYATPVNFYGSATCPGESGCGSSVYTFTNGAISLTYDIPIPGTSGAVLSIDYFALGGDSCPVSVNNVQCSMCNKIACGNNQPGWNFDCDGIVGTTCDIVSIPSPRPCPTLTFPPTTMPVTPTHVPTAPTTAPPTPAAPQPTMAPTSGGSSHWAGIAATGVVAVASSMVWFQL